MTTPNRKRRWYHATPDRSFIGLLVVQVFLLLSERFQWFAFNEHKGWTVLIAIGVVGVAVVVMLVWGLVSLCLRRRFQFSFRSLMVLLVAVSVPLGWFAWEMEKARRQRAVVEAFRKLGGDVYYDYQFDEMGNWKTGAKPTSARWFRAFLGCDFFDDVLEFDGFFRLGIVPMESGFVEKDDPLSQSRIWQVRVTDDDLMFVGELTTLEVLSVGGSRKITVDGLAHLHRLTNLTRLDVILCRNLRSVDGLRENSALAVLNLSYCYGLADVDTLRNLTNLVTLNLEYCTSLTDIDGLQRISGLERLCLKGTGVSDASLKHLTGLSKLEHLDLRYTKVTDDGVQRLQKALPNCEIQYGGNDPSGNDSADPFEHGSDDPFGHGSDDPF